MLVRSRSGIAESGFGARLDDPGADLGLLSSLVAFYAVPYMGAVGADHRLLCADLVRFIAGALRLLGRPAPLHAVCDAAGDLSSIAVLQEAAVAVVYEQFRFSYRVERSHFEPSAEALSRVAVSFRDVEASRDLPPDQHLSLCIFTPEEQKESLTALRTGGFSPKKTFKFEWVQRDDVMLCLVGDLAASVLSWRLGSGRPPVPYERVMTSEPRSADFDHVVAFRQWLKDEWSCCGVPARVVVVDALRALQHVGAFVASLGPSVLSLGSVPSAGGEPLSGVLALPVTVRPQWSPGALEGTPR